MAKQIKSSDIAESDIFGQIRKSAEETLGSLDKLNVELKETAKIVSNDLKNAYTGSAKGLNEFVNATKKANKLQQESEKIDQQKVKTLKLIADLEAKEERTKQAKITTESKELRLKQQKNREAEREAKAAKRAAQAAKDQNNAYKQLVKNTRDAKNESKRLGAEMLALEQAGKKNSKEYRKLASEYNRVTRAAQKGDKQLKKLDQTVGDNFRNVGNYRQAIGKLSSVLSGLGLAFGGAAIFRNVSDTIINFEQSIANLSSITGATGAELKKLEEAAMRLGGTTTLSAGQVAEGFKLIGSAKPELLENQEALIGVTESAITLAEAAGIELPEAASALTNTLNQFGAGAEQAGQFVDILAAGSKFGAGDINFLNSAFEKAGTVANVAGLEFRETAAALEVIAKSGAPAEKAGTDFRNVLINLQKEGLGFVDGQFEIRAALEQTKAMLEGIDDPAKRAAKAAKLFGKQSVATGQFLMQNIELYDDLNQKLAETGIAAEQQAINTDTLGGALDRVKSAWEEYILRTNDAGGISDTIKDILDSLARNLATILNTIIKVGKMWLWYKGVVLAQAAANKILASSFASGIKNLGMFKGAIKGVGTAFRKLGTAIKSNFVGIVIAAITEVIMTFKKINDIYAKTEENARDLAEAQKEVAESGKQEEREINNLFGALKKTNPESEERLNLINKINSTYGTTLQNLKDEKAFIDQVTAAQRELIATVQKKTEFESARIKFELLSKQFTEAEFEYGRAVDALNAFRSSSAAEQVFSNLFEYLGATGETELEQVKSAWFDVKWAAEKDLEVARKEYERLQVEMAAATPKPAAPTGTGTGTGTGTTTGATTAAKKFNTELETTYDLQEEINKAAEQYYQTQLTLDKLSREKQISDLDKLIEKEEELIDKQIELGEEPDMSNIKRYVRERKDLIIKGLEVERDEKIRKEEEAIDKRFNDEINRLTEQRDELLKQDKITGKAKKKINANYDKEVAEAREAWLKELEGFGSREAEIHAETQDKIVRQQEETDEKLKAIINRRAEIINSTFDREEKEYRLQLLNSNKTREEIEAAFTEYQIKQLEKRIKALKAAGADTLEEEIKLAELKRKVIEDDNTDIIDKEREAAEARIAIAKAITTALIELSDRRIKKIEEEIAAAEKQADFLRQKAIEGNIVAEESLAEQQRIIEEANARKEAEQRRQERIQFAQTAYEVYQRNATDENVSNPLAKTITDLTLLEQFVRLYTPTFLEGTEDTGTHGQGIDGKGGFRAILHPNERVLTKEQNARVGSMSNEALSKLAMEYQTGAIIRKGQGADQIGKAWESMAVVKRLESLENTIKAKPETNIEFGEIIGGAMQIIKSQKKGNSVVYNRYKVK